jgi:hypothetical protein
MREVKVLNRRFNYCTHEVLSFQPIDEDTKAGKPRLIWIYIEYVVCAINEGMFYSVTDHDAKSTPSWTVTSFTVLIKILCVFYRIADKYFLSLNPMSNFIDKNTQRKIYEQNLTV